MPSKKRKPSKHPTVEKEPNTGVYYVADADYQDYKHRVIPTVACDVCAKGAGQDGVQELKKCKGCNAAWYCSKECERAAWPEHKKYCGTLEVVESIQPRVIRLLEHPGLLHHLRVAIILALRLQTNPRPDECLNTRVVLQIVPTNDDHYSRLFSGTGSRPEEMQGCLQIFNVEGRGRIEINASNPRAQNDTKLFIKMWEGGRERATAAGRKDNPVVVVDFHYHGQDIPLGVEITREAFLTVLGMPDPPAFSLPIRQGPPIMGITMESILEKINRFIKEDIADRLGFRLQMRDYDLAFMHVQGQMMRRESTT